MWTDNDFLGERRSVAAYDYIRGVHARTLPLSRPAASRGGIVAVGAEIGCKKMKSDRSVARVSVPDHF
jgi:hypothetical protein